VAEDVVKRLVVTFRRGLPLGTHASFRYEGELWVAYPAEKSTRIHACIDRLLGVHARVQSEMVRWINVRPGDADLVARVVALVGRAAEIHEEMIVEKARAATE
jgi:hypothetical protein